MQFAFPPYPLRRQQRDGKQYVWDVLRKKWLVLSPEEFVRQQLVHYLLHEKGVSAALIAIEKEIRFHRLKKRLDVLVFDAEGKPFILCECKAPEVKLGQNTLHQIARYNVGLQAPHLLITNGLELWFFSKNEAEQYELQAGGWYK
ncbi:MAG: type I restriction enzyme HsdR N-terminal domain-containing protein [Bacteroidetes bacterium]|nr:MAG: type I restriction enzyme HsdR N-terminal domain-containing protein [Bacteroidota bacterium]